MDVGEAVRRLHELSWSVGDAAFVGPDGFLWQATGSKGSVALRTDSRTEAEAGRRAVEQAQWLAYASPNGHASLAEEGPSELRGRHA